MLQFIKSNKMFSAALAAAITVVLAVICYGFAAQNGTVMILGSIMLLAVIAYTLTLVAFDKEDNPC